MTDLADRLPGAVALLLALAMVAAGRPWRWLYAAQCAALAVAAAVQASGIASLLAAVMLLAQGAAVSRLLRDGPWPNPVNGLALLCGSVALAAFALATPLPAGFGIPLAMVLSGLLGAVSGDPRFGALLLLNGAQAACCLAPAAWLPVTVLAGLAAIVSVQGIPRLAALR